MDPKIDGASSERGRFVSLLSSHRTIFYLFVIVKIMPHKLMKLLETYERFFSSRSPTLQKLLGLQVMKDIANTAHIDIFPWER